MTRPTTPWRKQTLVAALILTVPMEVLADARYEALKSQVEVLQKQLKEVQQTLRTYEQNAVKKEEVDVLKKKVAQAAADSSEWKNADSVVHLAGYGDVTYSDGEGEGGNGGFTSARFNPIFHYQYKDLVMLESELELSVTDVGGTELNLEYLTIDLFPNDHLALAIGKFLSPIGQFRQNLHPSWINKLTAAPPGFGHDQAAPTTELGLQGRGGIALGEGAVYANYAVYVGNGPVLEIANGEIDAVGTEGRAANDDDRLVFGGRVGIVPIPMLELGVSAATGEVAGEDEPAALRDYDVFGTDFAFQRGNLGLRGEYVRQRVGSSVASAVPESAEWEAWYAQAAYRLAPTNWEGVVRYSDYRANHEEADQEQWALGVNYLFAPNTIAKAAYNFNENDSGSSADDDTFELQFSYGF